MIALRLAVFMFGAMIGSFLNLCACRIPKQKPFIISRSVCPQCDHVLGAPDLIPILSFLLLQGRCRYCRGKIPIRYLGMELLTGVLFAAVLSVSGFAPRSAIHLTMIGILLVAALIDMESLYIPNGLVLFGIISGLILNLVTGTATFSGTALGFLGGGIPMFTLYLLSRGGMGAGDVKLGAMMGLFLGWKLVLVGLFLSFFSGSLVGILLLVTGKKGRKDAIPFAPYLAFGGTASALWGMSLINWYLSLSGI